MEYFTIEIKLGSEKERAKSIAGNIEKGFELVKTFERKRSFNSWGNNTRRMANESTFRYEGSDSKLIYCAVLRRENTEYLEGKDKRKDSV